MTPVFKPYDISDDNVAMDQTYRNDILNPFMPLPRTLYRQTTPRFLIPSKTTIFKPPPLIGRDGPAGGILDRGEGRSFTRDKLGRLHLRW
jgi:hypothetical protein